MTERARNLRQNSTPVEKALWNALRGRRLGGHKFRRQWPVGGYILDLVCLERKIIIEADGHQHLERVEYDAVRDAYFQAQGYVVLRFWNEDILNRWEKVLERIKSALE